MLKKLLIVATFALVAVAPVQADEAAVAAEQVVVQTAQEAVELTQEEAALVAALVEASQGSAAQKANVQEQLEQLMTDDTKRAKIIRWTLIATAVAATVGVATWYFWPEIAGFCKNTYEKLQDSDDDDVVETKAAVPSNPVPTPIGVSVGFNAATIGGRVAQAHQVPA